MYEEHKLFESPPDEGRLWRYMSFTKLVSLLHRRALFFPRAKYLGDPFEGSLSRPTLSDRDLMFEDLRRSMNDDVAFEKVRDDMLRRREDAHRWLQDGACISSWVCSEIESAAMWSIYGGEEGVAVKTIFHRFREALIDRAPIMIGTVQYVDYDSVAIREDNVLRRFLFKRESFKYESEVRAIVMDWRRVAEETPRGPTVFASDVLAPAGITAKGAYVNVDLNRLVGGIAVSPTAPDWFLDLVEAVCLTWGIGDVSRSSLFGEPLR